MNDCIGCGGIKPDDNICCDNCWERVPTRLPEHNRYHGGPWRSELKRCRRMGGWSWNVAADILDAVKAWLSTHRVAV